MADYQAVSLAVRAIIEYSSSDDEEETLNLIFNYRAVDEDVVRIPRNENFVENVVPLFSETTFKQNFRLRPATFEYVLSVIAPVIGNYHHKTGRPPIAPKKQLLMALWYFATPDSYRSVCNNFNVGHATAVRTVRRVTQAIFDIGQTEIKWPSGTRATAVIEGFEAKCGFPEVIGAIDGTHIPIPAPRVDAASYVNRKGHHSIVLQAVCDHEARFTHCYAGQVGSVHDARVLRLSPIQQYINEDPTKFPNNSHIIGDPAYPCLNQMMVAFKENGHLTNAQKNYNYCLSSTRCVIERAFGFLKGRFRCLKYLDMYDIEEIPKVIISCCILHNICMRMHDEMEEDAEDSVDGNDYVEGEDIRLNEVNGTAKRLHIVNRLPMRYRHQ